MDESDQLLLNQLRFHGMQLKDGIQLANLAVEDVISICLQFLLQSGVPQFEISALRTSKSTFRQGGKIQELLLAQGLRFEIQTILNPNPNDSRRLIVSLLSKMTQESKTQDTRQLTFEERVAEERLAQTNAALQGFKQEWVNPVLSHHADTNTRFLRLHVMNILVHEPLIKQLANQGVRRHLFSSLTAALELKPQKQPQDQPLQERLQLIKKMRRQNDPDAFLAELKGQLAPEQEASEWEELQKGNRLIKKAQKLMKEDDKEEEEKRKQAEEENQGLFNLEIQFQEEIKQHVQDVDEYKNQLRQQLEQLQEAFKQQQKLLDQLEQQKQNIEDSNHRKNDELSDIQALNRDLQVEIENAHLILKQLESKASNDGEIQALERENEELQVEWEKERLQMKTDIDEAISKAQERRQKVDQLQDKLRRLHEENQMIRNQGRLMLDRKDQLILEFQNMPKEANRQVYIKKINDLRNNLDKQKQEYLKVAKEVQQLTESLESQNNTIARYGIELENLLNTDPKKAEQIAKTIAKQYLDYRNIYKQSIQAIENIGVKRIQVYDIDIKTDQLLGKGYKTNVEKMKADLNDIKTENQRLAKQKSQQ